MPEYMIVWKDPDTGDVWASFYEAYKEAKDALSMGTVSVGNIGVLYWYTFADPDDEYSGKEYVMLEA